AIAGAAKILHRVERTAFQYLDHSSILAGKTIEIPVDYGGEYATDLPALCNLSGLSDREVVRIHHEAAYRVFALGSAPG
ncbi:carboxyltransferase domain-containing protein, partial [Rhizobium ruizarguesonis]